MAVRLCAANEPIARPDSGSDMEYTNFVMDFDPVRDASTSAGLHLLLRPTDMSN